MTGSSVGGLCTAGIWRSRPAWKSLSTWWTYVAEFLTAGHVSTVPREGDEVVGSDHLTIGTVTAVVQGDGDNPGYLLVPRGLVFKRGTYIPLDAVAKVGDHRVFVNAPRLFVRKMPWGRPPSTAAKRQKLGAPKAQVRKLYGSRSPSVDEGER